MKHPGDYMYRMPRRRRAPRVGRAALVCGLLFVLACVVDRACADEFAVLAGVGTTSGMGEQGAAPEAALTYASRHLALEGSWYGAAKLESGAGFGLRGAAEARWHGLGAGLAYSYRDGGTWVKSYVWARVSYTQGPIFVSGDWALGGYNKERRVEVRATARRGHLVLQPRFFFIHHLQGNGFGVALMFGVGL